MTMYADTVAKLKYDWLAMLARGKMPIIELQDANGELCMFAVDLVHSGNNSLYFIYETTNGLKRLRVGSYCDCLDTYLSAIYDRLVLELA